MNQAHAHLAPAAIIAHQIELFAIAPGPGEGKGRGREDSRGKGSDRNVIHLRSTASRKEELRWLQNQYHSLNDQPS